MEKKERAVELKHNSYNCAQAVISVFGEELGLTEDAVKKIGAGFGLGMGCMDGDCGALCGAQVVLGFRQYKGAKIHKEARELYQEFVRRTGAPTCREIKGADTGKMLCSCEDCIRHAIDIIETEF